MPRLNAFAIASVAALSLALQLSGASARDISRSVLPGLGQETSRTIVEINMAPWRARLLPIQALPRSMGYCPRANRLPCCA
jgi:hypothetical protein